MRSCGRSIPFRGLGIVQLVRIFMIPQFPEFKKLELNDREEVESFTARFPPYSDFDFASIWSWDVKEEMGVSQLNGSLVIKFTDYVTGQPLLSFLGEKNLNDTARELIRHTTEGSLALVPEVSVTALDPAIFRIEESREHFDYVCNVANHIEYSDPKLKSHRKLLRQFTASHPNFEHVSLNMTTEEVQRDVARVYTQWNETRGFLTVSEAFAFERFLAATAVLPYTAVGVRVDGRLIAFHVASLPSGTCADALFSKADTQYRGVYAALDHVVALDLIKKGYSHMNIQQDLGIPNLRKAKMSLHPEYFLRKYTISLLPK